MKIRSEFLMCSMVALLLTGCASPQHGRDHPTSQDAVARKDVEVVSLLGEPLYAVGPGPKWEELAKELDAARAALADDPDNPEKLIWVGRRLGYLLRMSEAIGIFTVGIDRFPDDARFYRHRGHRYISVRRFKEAAADLERAAELIDGKPDEIEPDGMPNAQNIPLTTTAFNVWYHLGLARYLQGDFEGAIRAYARCMGHTRGIADNVVAVTDWMYMAMRRAGHDGTAAGLLAGVSPDMTIIENAAYHRRCLMYKGMIEPDDLLDPDRADSLDIATLGYGLGNWYLVDGDPTKAAEVFTRVVSGTNWAAFGFIAAEAELARAPGP